MILRQHSEHSLHWMMAFGLSTVVHAGVFVMLFDLWPSNMTPARLPNVVPDISVMTVIFDEATLGAAEAPEQNPTPTTLPEAEPEPQTLTSSQPEPEVASEPDPETLVPERIEPVAPVDITRLNPIRPEDGTTLQGVTPLTVTPERLAAITPNPQGAEQPAPLRLTPVNAPPLTQPPAPSAAPLTPEEATLNDLVQRIRDRFGDPCLVALPQRQNGGDPLVIVVAAQDRVINTFTQAVLNDADTPIEHRSVLIDARQCPALNLARESTNYPSFRLSMNLRTPIVSNGGRLIGTINNVAGMYTSLLLIDDNGVVQDLRRFTSFVSGRAEFDVPVSRAGAARDTSQLLLAVATQTRPNTISQRAGRLAKDFFPALQDELGSGAIIALVPFEVR